MDADDHDDQGQLEPEEHPEHRRSCSNYQLGRHHQVPVEGSQGETIKLRRRGVTCLPQSCPNNVAPKLSQSCPKVASPGERHPSAGRLRPRDHHPAQQQLQWSLHARHHQGSQSRRSSLSRCFSLSKCFSLIKEAVDA